MSGGLDGVSRILIADDQPDVLESLRLLLKPEGFRFAAATRELQELHGGELDHSIDRQVVSHLDLQHFISLPLVHQDRSLGFLLVDNRFSDPIYLPARLSPATSAAISSAAAPAKWSAVTLRIVLPEVGGLVGFGIGATLDLHKRPQRCREGGIGRMRRTGHDGMGSATIQKLAPDTSSIAPGLRSAARE